MSIKLVYGILLVSFYLCGFSTTNGERTDWVVSLGYEDKKTFSYVQLCMGALVGPKRENSGRIILITARCAKELSYRPAGDLQAKMEPLGLRTKSRYEKIIKIIPVEGELPEFSIALVDAKIDRGGATLPTEAPTDQVLHAAEWKNVDGRCSSRCSYKLKTKNLRKMKSDKLYKENGFIISVRKNAETGIMGSPIYAADATLFGLYKEEEKMDKTTTKRIYYDMSNDARRHMVEGLIEKGETALTERDAKRKQEEAMKLQGRKGKVSSK